MSALPSRHIPNLTISPPSSAAALDHHLMLSLPPATTPALHSPFSSYSPCFLLSLLPELWKTLPTPPAPGATPSSPLAAHEPRDPGSQLLERSPSRSLCPPTMGTTRHTSKNPHSPRNRSRWPLPLVSFQASLLVPHRGLSLEDAGCGPSSFWPPLRDLCLPVTTL